MSKVLTTAELKKLGAIFADDDKPPDYHAEEIAKVLREVSKKLGVLSDISTTAKALLEAEKKEEKPIIIQQPKKAESWEFEIIRDRHGYIQTIKAKQVV